MNPIVPKQREHKVSGNNHFNDLVAYIEGEKEKGQGFVIEKQLQLPAQFNDLLNYATNPLDKEAEAKKCIAIRTHGIKDLSSAALEMNYVASQNIRCKDPAYHIILSWPEHERPKPEDMFDAAEHAIKALGLAEHQYVIAIHDDTDNIHCHISVNRIHPVTYKSRNIEWSHKTLQLAARQSEIKHGWTHDNGIYIVQKDGHGKKHIVLNPDHAQAVTRPHAHSDLQTNPAEELLPTWNDPESLESWLKTKVAKELKHALPELDGWPALHAWLSHKDITLTDSGGGGLRLHATSPETGELLNLAASKGLRAIKRPELEKGWGPFSATTPIKAKTPDLSHLTQEQLTKGIENVLGRDHGANKPPDAILARTPGLGRPPEHVLRAQQHPENDVAEEGSGLHELPAGGVDAQKRGDTGVLLPNALPRGVGDNQAGQDNDVRRTGAGETGGRSERSLKRDNAKRQERKEQRALARLDLRQRFAQYKRFVSNGDTAHFLQIKEIQKERRETLKEISAESKAAKAAIPKGADAEIRFLSNIEINAEVLRRRLQANAAYQEKYRRLREIRAPAMAWRTWLYEQSNLGDRAALSALRGIVYQAQRDAKKNDKIQDDEVDADNFSAQQYKKTMARLLEEEKREAAIRSADHYSMRPYEADALLASYLGIKWHVTGNGNVEYSAQEGNHLFTDRGNRVTFDRVRVTDEEIRLALAHAEQKFGGRITLTGEDQAFTERMARLSDDMGITVLNPEMAGVIERHRENRLLEITQAITINPDDIQLEITPAQPTQAIQPGQPPKPIQHTQQPEFEPKPNTKPEPPEILPTSQNPPAQPKEVQKLQPLQPPKTRHERLRESVLSIDPRATFIVVDPENSPNPYFGAIAAVLENDEPGFAQHTGRSVYALHPEAPPKNYGEAVLEIFYINGHPTIKIPNQDKGKEK